MVLLLLFVLLLLLLLLLTGRLLVWLVTVRSLPSMVHFTDQQSSDTLPTEQNTHARGPFKIVVRLSASL